MLEAKSSEKASPQDSKSGESGIHSLHTRYFFSSVPVGNEAKKQAGFLPYLRSGSSSVLPMPLSMIPPKKRLEAELVICPKTGGFKPSYFNCHEPKITRATLVDLQPHLGSEVTHAYQTRRVAQSARPSRQILKRIVRVSKCLPDGSTASDFDRRNADLHEIVALGWFTAFDQEKTSIKDPFRSIITIINHLIYFHPLTKLSMNLLQKLGTAAPHVSRGTL